MSNSGGNSKFDAIRVLSFSSITSSYQALGGVFLRDAKIVAFKNNTDADLSFSLDQVSEHKRMPAFSADILDEKTNDMFMQAGTQWNVKYTTGAPTKGWVDLEVIWV